MAVNGIEIKVGQVWRTRGGQQVMVSRTTNNSAYPFGLIGATDEFWGTVTSAGAVSIGDNMMGDLVELISPAPKSDIEDYEEAERQAAKSNVLAELVAEVFGTKSSVDARALEVGKFSAALSAALSFAVPPAEDPPASANDTQVGGDHVELISPTNATQPLSAIGILDSAAGHMRDRAAIYDSPDGERSMGAAVTAFNAITKHTLTEAEGWLLMQVLKDVRLFQRAAFHQDSAEDCVAYAALKAEAKAKGGAQ